MTEQSDVQPQFEDIYRLIGLESPTLRRADVAAQSGVDPSQSVRWWRAMGFPEVDDTAVAFSESDVAIVRQLRALIDAGALGDEDVLRLARVSGSAFSRLVEAQLDVMPDLTAGGAALDNVDNGDNGERNVIAFIESTMSYVWKRHLVAALAHQLSVGSSDQLEAVGFADLSGFSQVSKKATSGEIADIVESFETIAFDVVSAHDGRVVKFIGDEVMFVANDLDAGVDICVALISALAGDERVPPVHCGLAFGPTVPVGGDVFGPTVNLASRLTGVARPDTLVVPRTDGKHLLERNDLDSRAVRRPFDLKGIGRTRLISVRPLDEPVSAAPEPGTGSATA